jgi:hypothetical protein
MIFKSEDEKLIALLIEDLKTEIISKQDYCLSATNEMIKLEFYRDIYGTILEERECPMI